MPVTLYSATCSLIWLIKQLFLFIPVYLVLGLIGVDWYVFVIRWGLGKTHSFMPGIYLLCTIFTFIVWMILWSYARTILTSSAVHDNPPPVGYFTKLAELLPGQPERTCVKCAGAPKPLRSHHCSICERCILKMDHHCPWVATCVGFKNYKYFVLFVMWGCLGCTMYLIVGLQMLTSMFTNPELADGFTGLLSSLLTAAFAVSLLFFSGYHLYLVFTGTTTIEASLSRRQARRETPHDSDQLTSVSADGDIESQTSVPTQRLTEPASYSAGSLRANWDAVFGSNPWLWFFPVNTLKETGYEFDFLLVNDEEEPLSGGNENGRSNSVELDDRHRMVGGSPLDHSRSPRARGMDLDLGSNIDSNVAINLAQHKAYMLAHQQHQQQIQQQLQQADSSPRSSLRETSEEEQSMSAIVRELNQ